MIEIIHINRTICFELSAVAESGLHHLITKETGLLRSEYYLTQNGKRLPVECTSASHLDERIPLRLQERLTGGKGGFGSMLRAIGAQIEKTTNREACRDLSGRRLRDINEEKRLKAYLEKQREAPEDEAAKLQKKIDKLLAKPKHEFHDEGYNRARSDLTQNVDEAVQEGFLKAINAEKAAGSVKRKAEEQSDKSKAKKKKVKGSLWLGSEDLGSSSSSDSESESDSASSSSGSASTSGSSSAGVNAAPKKNEEKFEEQTETSEPIASK